MGPPKARLATVARGTARTPMAPRSSPQARAGRTPSPTCPTSPRALTRARRMTAPTRTSKRRTTTKRAKRVRIASWSEKGSPVSPARSPTGRSAPLAVAPCRSTRQTSPGRPAVRAWRLLLADLPAAPWWSRAAELAGATPTACVLRTPVMLAPSRMPGSATLPPPVGAADNAGPSARWRLQGSQTAGGRPGWPGRRRPPPAAAEGVEDHRALVAGRWSVPLHPEGRGPTIAGGR